MLPRPARGRTGARPSLVPGPTFRAPLVGVVARLLLVVPQADQQQGAGGGAEHRVGDAAEHEPPQPPTAVGRHRDQVCVPLAGVSDDDRPRVANRTLDPHPQASVT